MCRHVCISEGVVLTLSKSERGRWNIGEQGKESIAEQAEGRGASASRPSDGVRE
jgi:hypothetical protein